MSGYLSCDAYLTRLATADVEEIGRGEWSGHADGCGECARVTSLVLTRERNRLSAYDTLQPRSLARSMAEGAHYDVYAEAHARHVRRMYGAGGVLVALALVVWIFAARLFPSGETMIYASAQEPVFEELYLLHCLSPDAAGMLARRHVGPDARVELHGSAMRVNARLSEQEALRSELAQYGSPNGSCPAPAPTPGSAVPEVITAPAPAPTPALAPAVPAPVQRNY